MSGHALPLRSTLVSDALDELGLPAQRLAPAPAPLRPSWSAVGRALPALIEPAPSGSEHALGYLELIDAVRPGDVVLLGLAPDLPRSAVWGELLASAAHAAGAVAVVTAGCVRDVASLTAGALPVFAAGTCERRPDGRVDVAAVGEPVTIGGAAVRRDDWLVADGDGVVVLEPEHTDVVAQAAAKREAHEARIADALSAGLPLREALRGAAGVR
jgi:4-hydroxy-4-methyl-2-oxoglutarate aldolase